MREWQKKETVYFFVAPNICHSSFFYSASFKADFYFRKFVTEQQRNGKFVAENFLNSISTSEYLLRNDNYISKQDNKEVLNIKERGEIWKQKKKVKKIIMDLSDGKKNIKILNKNF